jgi:hypothetical protein
MTTTRFIRSLSFTVLINLSIGATAAEIYASKQDCLKKNGDNALWLCDSLVYGKPELNDWSTQERNKIQDLYDKGVLKLEKFSPSPTPEREAITTPVQKTIQEEYEQRLEYQQEANKRLQLELEYEKQRLKQSKERRIELNRRLEEQSSYQQELERKIEKLKNK